jgi:PAS domain S-box-containing protein
MENNALSYFLLAQGFIVLIILIAITGLWLNYRNSRKLYLAITCAAGMVEASRQLPDLMLRVFPESAAWNFLSISLQFSASLILVLALIRIKGEVDRNSLLLMGISVLGFAVSVSLQFALYIPENTQNQYFYSLPIIFLTALIVWRSWLSSENLSPSRFFLLMTSALLLIVRVASPAIDDGDTYLLVYYIELLLFPVMMAALVLAEVEFAYDRVEKLLAGELQREKDLQFILDHSLDVILTTDEVGLLRSWNMRAEQQFGCSEQQTVGKIHIDELFVDNYRHKNVSDPTEFQSQMEHTNGNSFWVKVRMQTIVQDDQAYSIYVLRDTSELDRLAESQVELDRELQRVHELREAEKKHEDN